MKLHWEQNHRYLHLNKITTFLNFFVKSISRKFHCDFTKIIGNNTESNLYFCYVLIFFFSYYSNDPLPFACDQCEVKKHSKTALNAHKKKYHKPRQMIKCEMCDYQTDHKITMTRHLRGVHLNLKDFQCWKCPKTFKAKKSLNYHLVRTHNEVCM